MFFTQEDYRKIEKWLLANSRKDTDFVGAATPLKGNETVVLVQDGKNVKTSVKDIVDQFFLLGVSDLLNITDKYGESYISIDQAIQLIPFRSRKEGQVITFLNTDGNWEIYQFIGKLNQWNNPTLWNNPFDWEKLIVDSILPDEEDLTKSAPDAKGNAYLSLKDRKYEPDKYSGLGRKILRRRVIEIEDPIYGTQEKNLLLQADFAEDNTVYVVRYDFTLNGQDITLPDNSYIEYEGGSISDGNIIDRAGGLNRVVLKKNIINGKNILTQEMVSKSNTIYEIRYDYNLNGNTVTIPEGCILDMRGGSVTNGTINCVDTIIISTDANKLDVTLTGTYRFDSEKLVTSNTEDINIIQSIDRKSHTISAMLANRDTTNGMGYAILRKDKSFKEQVTQENTIYEIRYDFDLNGEEITIPEGCVLDFQGGSLSNGILSGAFITIAGLYKIYNNIKFVGSCTNNIYELDWFVKNKNTTFDLSNKKKDSTEEIQAAFDCGILQIHVSNQFYYYISSPLYIYSYVSLTGNNVSLQHVRMENQQTCCFYTDLPMTILNIIASSKENTIINKSILVDNINITSAGPIAANDYHEDIALVKVYNDDGPNSQSWGVYLNINISYLDMLITDEHGNRLYKCGYTGLDIRCTNPNGYFTYIVVDGYIRNLYKTINIVADEGWITDVRLDYDSTGVYGGVIKASPVRITGSHQPRIELVGDDSDYYFEVNKGVSTGFVWDLGNTKIYNGVEYHAVRYGFKTTRSDFYDLCNSKSLLYKGEEGLPEGVSVSRFSTKDSYKFLDLHYNYLEKVFHKVYGWQMTDNIANGISYVNTDDRGNLESIKFYNNNGDSIIGNEYNIRNYNKLFNVSGDFYQVGTVYDYTGIHSVFTGDDNYNKYEAIFKFTTNELITELLSGAFLCCTSMATIQKNLSVLIEYYDESDVLISVEELIQPKNLMYYTGMWLIPIKIGSKGSKYIRIKCIDNYVNQWNPIAKFGIITKAGSDNVITSAGGEIGGRLVLHNLKLPTNLSNISLGGSRHLSNKYININYSITNNNYVDILRYDTVYKYPVFIYIESSIGNCVIYIENNTISCDNFNFGVKLTYSTSGNKYLVSIKSIKSCTIFIYHVHSLSGISFKPLDSEIIDGEEVELGNYETKNITSKRPSNLTTKDSSFQYFDTTLNKPIWWTGTKWVDATGASV